MAKAEGFYENRAWIWHLIGAKGCYTSFMNAESNHDKDLTNPDEEAEAFFYCREICKWVHTCSKKGE